MGDPKATPQPPVLMDVHEMHLDEASWLWTQWERALLAPDFDLADTAAVEERLLAHVDGLVEGGSAVAKALLWPALEQGDLSQVYAAMLALAQAGLPLAQLRALLHGTSPEQHPALQRALQLHEATSPGGLLSLLDAEGAELQALLLEVLVFRDEAPEGVLRNFLAHPLCQLKALALRSLHTLPWTESRRLLEEALVSPSSVVRDAAIEVGLTMGARAAWESCRLAMKSAGSEPLVLWAMGGSEEDVESLVELLRAPERRADALWALGFSGRVSAAEACLKWMEDEEVARLAGEAFSSITGLHLEGQWVRSEEEPLDQPGPLDEPNLDADLTPRAEDDLPRPDVEAVTAWWRQARGGFERGTRYLMGHALQADVLLTALERGPMRRRHVWARELSLRSKGTCRVVTRALTARQRAQLRQARASGTRFSMAPFSRLLAR